MLDDAHAFWLRAPGEGEIRPARLPEPGRAQPERVRGIEHVLCLGLVCHLRGDRDGVGPGGTRERENRFGASQSSRS